MFRLSSVIVLYLDLSASFFNAASYTKKATTQAASVVASKAKVAGLGHVRVDFLRSTQL